MRLQYVFILKKNYTFILMLPFVCENYLDSNLATIKNVCQGIVSLATVTMH